MAALSSPPVAFVLRALGLGDFLTGVAALRALRAALPGHHLVLAGPTEVQPLVRLAAVADQVQRAVGLADLEWTGPTPDIAVNLHGRGPQSSRLLQDLNPQRLVAFGCHEAGVAGPGWRSDEHEVSRWCRLVGEALGVPADPADLVIAPPETSPLVEAAVVIHPGAAYESRRWPAGRFAEVAVWASATGRPVVITGSAAERKVAEQVARDADLPADRVLAGRTTLVELAALVASARLVICGDTGVAHLATALRTPSVVLFGPVSPQLWGPPDTGEHVALWHHSSAGDPWGHGIDPALLEISVDEVIDAAGRLLGHGTSHAGRR